MNIPENLLNNSISIEDASSILKSEIDKNDTTETIIAKKYYNGMVDEWYNEVLKKSTTEFTTKSIVASWSVFQEGKYVKNLMKYEKMINRPKKEVLNFWVNIFKTKSVDEMIEMGTQLISSGYDIVMTESRFLYMKEKYDKLYKKSDNPLYWERHYKTISVNPNNMFGNDTERIQHKIKIIFNHEPRPQ